MNVGEHIKEIRKKRGISAEELAEKLEVSLSTLYRYENASISKIPIDIIDKICPVLGVTTAELTGNSVNPSPEALPATFSNASDAMTFILKMPVLAAYGGYDLDSMDEETIIHFANEILEQLKLVSYKYKKQ